MANKLAEAHSVLHVTRVWLKGEVSFRKAAGVSAGELLDVFLEALLVLGQSERLSAGVHTHINHEELRVTVCANQDIILKQEGVSFADSFLQLMDDT